MFLRCLLFLECLFCLHQNHLLYELLKIATYSWARYHPIDHQQTSAPQFSKYLLLNLMAKVHEWLSQVYLKTPQMVVDPSLISFQVQKLCQCLIFVEIHHLVCHALYFCHLSYFAIFRFQLLKHPKQTDLCFLFVV